MKTVLIAFALTFVTSTAFAASSTTIAPGQTKAMSAVNSSLPRVSHDTHEPRLVHASAKTTMSHASRASFTRSARGRR